MSDTRTPLSTPKAFGLRTLLTELESAQTQLDTARLWEQTRLDRPGQQWVLDGLERASDHVYQARWELEDLLKNPSR
jgi:hypothetical protein